MAKPSGLAAHVPAAKRYVRVLDRVTTPVAALLDEGLLTEAATELGLMIEGRFLGGGPNELASIIDFAMHELRRDGLTVIERALFIQPPLHGTPDDLVVRGMVGARFSVFLADGIDATIGMHLYDMLGGPPRFLYDASFGQPAFLGQRFAGRVLTIGEISLPIGIFLPLDQVAADDILDELLASFPDREIDDLHDLPPEDRADVTAIIMVAALEATLWFAERLLREGGTDPRFDPPDGDGFIEPVPLALPMRKPPSGNPKKIKKRRR